MAYTNNKPKNDVSIEMKEKGSISHQPTDDPNYYCAVNTDDSNCYSEVDYDDDSTKPTTETRTVHQVIARTAKDTVITGRAVYRVIARVPQKRIVPQVTRDQIVARAAVDKIVAVIAM